MIPKLNEHYSMTNPASIYDEESLTALELAGRTAYKVNEVIDDQNTLRSETESKMAEQDDRLTAQEQTQIPNTVTTEIHKQINNGTFDRQINTYAGNLEARLDNLLGSVTQGSTTMDAEVIDLRTDINGNTHSSAGESIRLQINDVKTTVDNLCTYKNLANPEEFTTNKYINKQGIVRDDANYFYTGYIAVTTGDTIFCTKSRFITTYNNGALMSELGSDVSGATHYTVPEGVTHIIITAYIEDIDEFMVCVSAETEHYIPYGDLYVHDNVEIGSVVKTNARIDGIERQLVTRGSEITLTPDFLVENDFVNLKGYYVKPENNNKENYAYYKIPVNKGAYLISGTSYKLIRLFYVTDENDKVIAYYPNSVDMTDDTKYSHNSIYVNVPIDNAFIYINRYQWEPVSIYHGVIVGSQTSDFLYGKNWYACGDSFTAGDFSGLQPYEYLLATGKYVGKKQVYPYIIGNRTGMNVVNLAQGGMTMAKHTDRSNDFVTSKYTEIGSDADYITLKFGINDSNYSSPIGTIDSTDVTTFYGAYNTIMDYLTTNFPHAKIGIIVTNGANQSIADATVNIAKKWGVPYIDEWNDERVPLLHRVRRAGVTNEVYDRKLAAFRVSESNTHPNVKAQEYESTFIETWLRTL